MNDNSRLVNPYAPPKAAPVPVIEPVTREEATRRLRTPAICLAISASGALLGGLVALPFPIASPTEDIRAQPLLLIPIAALLVMLPLVVLGAAINVIRRPSQPWIWVAIVSGLIPLGTPCVCFNVVFALWLLHLAMQRPIRDALRSNREAV